MKKNRLSLGILLVLVLISFVGCTGIPLGQEIDAETIYGKRINKQTGGIEEVLQRKVRQNNFVLFSPDGGGKRHWIYIKYYLKSGDDILPLPHLENAKEMNDSGFCYKIENPIIPVFNSGNWIATQKYYMERDHVGINLIIFNKNKIVKKMKISNCLRSGPFSGTYGLEYKAGNTKIIFHTTEGEFFLDISKDTFKKI